MRQIEGYQPLQAPGTPTFREALLFWLKLGFISFGGPSGQIAIMHTELVERRRWISEARFLHALNFCMLLPGPEAQQLSIYIGWLLHRTKGGMAAGILFVLPSAVLLWVLSYLYVVFGHLSWISAIFSGLKPAVVAIVFCAVLRIGNKALKNELMWLIAGLAFCSLHFLNAAFPLVIFVAAVLGWLGGRFWPEKFLVIRGHCPQGSGEDSCDQSKDAPEPSLGRAARVLGVGLFLWWVPILLVGLCLGWQHSVFQQGVFFSKAAMVTFGGAYAVLPYVSQFAVEHFHWLSPEQMIDGLGLAETTPGPLIMVLQFVGFLGGWNQPGNLSPLVAATLGAMLTTWATFVPCFIWIFLAGPFIERLRGMQSLTTTLSAVTAAVVGVILNLGVWFAAHVIFEEAKGIDIQAFIIACSAFFGMWRFKIPVVMIIGLAALSGMLLSIVN